MTAHICAPPPVDVAERHLDCPTCEATTLFVVASYEWYGAEFTCLSCGERFNEEGRCERPFSPGWRKRSIRQAWALRRRYSEVAP